MSLLRPLVNAYLRGVVRSRMARAADPQALRLQFDRQARWFFRAPRGTRQAWRTLSHGPRAVDILDVSPTRITTDAVVLYLHGGGFIFGSPQTHAAMAGALAQRLGCRVLLPRYRLAPEAPFPAAPQDVRHAWEALIAAGLAPGRVVLGGDSAGGALALGLLADLLRRGEAGPAGVFCFSPLTEMTFSAESLRSNAAREAVLPPERTEEMRRMYLGDHPPDDPQASPLFAAFEGAPPVWLTVGDCEILRDDARRMADKLRQARVEVTFEEVHDLPHVWPLLHNTLPEARATLDAVAAWIRRCPGWSGES